MGNGLGLLISALAACGGVAGLIRPELYRGSLEEQYTAGRARVAGVVLLLMGLAALWAILHDTGAPVDFFPA